jgi:hypothetical protein
VTSGSPGDCPVRAGSLLAGQKTSRIKPPQEERKPNARNAIPIPKPRRLTIGTIFMTVLCRHGHYRRAFRGIGNRWTETSGLGWCHDRPLTLHAYAT